ncbi:MAG: PfkB family carbohydrate kinase [Candidatus Omnitrophota bacterium]
MPGGAANVANNIMSLGGQAYLAGVVGNDERGGVLTGELVRKGINVDGIVTDASRPTILKTRVIAHQQQVVRIDKETTEVIKPKVINRVIAYVERAMDKIDALIIEDYGKGLIVPELLKPIVKMAKKRGKIVAVDPKEDHFSYYKGVTVITPNHHEASKAAGIKMTEKTALKKIGQTLLNRYQTRVVLVTLGEEGMAVFEHGKPYKKIDTVAQEVYDVSGAGDTVIASYALSLVSGATAIQAAHIANCAAGIVVGKVGISVVDQDELLGRIREELGKL